MELLPCPFCGGKATFDHDDNGWYWIVCEKCWTATNSRTHTMEDCHPLLAEQWNRRVIPLHEMLDDCRKQFDDWWAEFTAAHEDWRFADSDALRWQAWQAAWNLRASPASAPAEAPNYRIADRGFRWDAENRQHIPQLLIEFAPVPANEPNDSKGWKDRDSLAAMLAAAPTPPVSEDRKDAERWKWITRDGRTRGLRIPANENKASIDAAIDGAIKKAMQEDKP